MHRGLCPASSTMTAHCLILSLLQALVLLLSSASASQFNTTEACNFTFSLGDLPNFRLPEAGPNSPGDVQLNAGNNIITRGWLEGENGSLDGCNGDSGAYYVEDNTWNTTYISNDGDELEIDVFYATYHNQLWVRHLQPHMDPSLYEVLNGTIIRLNITCWDEETETIGCVEFTANFTDATPYNYSEPFDFVDDCSHGFSSGLQVPSVQIHAASPVGPTNSASLGTGISLILAGKADQGLPWSEGFTTNGSKKTDEFWGDFWATVNSSYSIKGASGTCDLDIPGIQTQTTCCPVSCGTCGGDECGEMDGGDSFSGEEACCESGVSSLGRDCSVTGEAPCTIPDYYYLGCYRDGDNSRDRTMTRKRIGDPQSMTAEWCAEYCAGSKHFGTQSSNGCWCGPEDEDADYDKHGTADNCNMACTGDSDEICGGHWAMSTYEFPQATITSNALAVNEESSCTGTSAQVWNPSTGEWLSTFQTIDGERHDIDMFYLNLVDGANELWVTEIESWMAPSLYNQLQHNYVKLNVTCPDDNTIADSCVIFEPTFTNWSPEVDGAMAGFRFSDPALPTFDLPEAVPNSPGDVLLTTGNEVVTKTGATTETFCNGDSVEYYGEDGYWYNEFVKSDGETYGLVHVFYPLQRNLYAATIQANWEPNLRGLLENRTIRIRVWCTNDESAQYLFFRVSGESSTCDDIDNLCTDVVESEALQLVPTFAQCATTVAAAYLGWLSS